MMKSNKIIITLSICAIFVGVLVYFLNQITTPIQVSSQGEVILGEKAFLVEVADTDTLRTRGLSGHVPLSEEEGMLFIFDRPDNYGFWMKDMNFPIDIVWMDESLKIVHIEKNISPETYPKVLRPTEKSLFVLEISAGQSDLLNIKVGDEVKFLRK